MLAREIASRQLSTDSGWAARGGLGGRRPARSEAFSWPPSCLPWAPPEGGSEVRSPSATGARRGPTVLISSLDFKNAPLCAFGWSGARRRVRLHSLRLVLGARCARPRAGPGAAGAGVHTPPPACPAPPASRHRGLRERWAEKIHSVPGMFPGNLSFRRYTCVYLGGGATTEPVFFSPF